METVHWLWDQVSWPKEPVLETIWASTPQNQSSGFRTKQDSNQSPQLQRLARKL